MRLLSQTAPLDLAESLRIQGRVLLALILREARTKYGRQKLGYFWALVEPAMHITVFYLLFTFTFRVVPLGHGIVIFLLTGIGTYLSFQAVMDRTSGAYASNEALLAYPVVKIFDVFLGRALLELATWLLVSFLMLGTLIMFDVAPMPRSVLLMLLAISLLWAIGFGVGVVLGVITEFLPSLGTVLRIPFRLLYFTSGGFFLPEAMPPGVRSVIVWNPILHGITLFREGYYPRYDSFTLDISYLAWWAACCVLIAFVVVRVSAKPLRSRV